MGKDEIRVVWIGWLYLTYGVGIFTGIIIGIGIGVFLTS